MADHLVLALMVGKRDGAILALELFAAGATKDYRGISAAVEQDHDLLFAFKTIFDLGGEFAGDDLLVARFLELEAHVHDFDFG